MRGATAKAEREREPRAAASARRRDQAEESSGAAANGHLDPRSLAHLQKTAGNAAVGALVEAAKPAAAKGAGAPAAAAPPARAPKPAPAKPAPRPKAKPQPKAEPAAEPKAPEAAAVVETPAPAAGGGGTSVPPEQAPGFQKVKARVGAAAAKTKAHPPARAKAAEAQAAAAGPSNDVASQAAGAQVETIAAQPPGTFDKAAFIAAVKKAVDAAAPKNLSEAADFKESGKAGQVKDQVRGMVGSETDASRKPVEDATKAPPDESAATPKPVTPMADEKPGAPPAAVDGGDAMPPPKTAEETSLEQGKAEVAQPLAEADVTEEQLKKGNEPQFDQALAAKKEAEAHADEAPKAYREQEQSQLKQARGEADAKASGGLEGLHRTRAGALGRVQAGKRGAKAADEAKRAKVAAEIEAIYRKTKDDTTKILDGIDAKVTKAFESGEKAARDDFESYVDREMSAYKKRRYSGLLGKGRWIKDKFCDLPDEVNVFYAKGREMYLGRMTDVINNVADIVAADMTAAKARITQGRIDIKQYVTSLPKDLKQVGREASEKISSQFDELDQQVEAKQSELVDSLAQKYVAARDALDSRIAEMKEANKGLISKAKDAIVGVIETIKKLKDLLLNVLARAASVIGGILKNPIGFLGNLVGAVKTGLSNFVSNIGAHLKAGLQQWLFGALAGAGLELPAKFDLRGIIHLIAQLLGLTWSSIRARIVKALGKSGERIMSALEKASEIVQLLVKEGPAGLWKFIVEKISDLKEMVLGKIKEFIITKIITAGITWLISLLNPAAAFIKACKAIVDIVKFFIERGSEIVEFVNTVLDSIGAIASGAIGGAAAAIENVLKKILPLAISFLASLLGLGGISEKIRSIIEAVQRPVGKVIGSIIGGVVKVGKKLLSKLFGRKKKDKKKETPDSKKVKEVALAEVLSRARGKKKIEDFHAVIADVRKKYKPQGLNALDARVDPASLAITVVAKASPETERTISWDEAFSPDENPKNVLETLRRRVGKVRDKKTTRDERNAVWAAISVNGRVIGREERNNTESGDHAEEVVGRMHWGRALQVAQETAEASPGEVRVVFAVSASPCGTKCARYLQKLLAGARSRFEKYGGRVKFILAPVSAYEGRKGDMSAATKGKDFENLAEAGWDLRQLMSRPRGGGRSWWDVPLAEFFHKLAERFGRLKK